METKTRPINQVLQPPVKAVKRAASQVAVPAFKLRKSAQTHVAVQDVKIDKLNKALIFHYS
jgi:hypothetical protein